MNVPWLDSHAEDDLREVVRRSKTNTAHISADSCEACGGYGCDRCRNCPCPRCDPYVPEYVRTSEKKWRPAS